MSEDAFQTQLDLVNQTTLIKILAQTIKENERLSLANQDSSNAPGNHLQSISHQIEVQKQRLEALRRSNEEIILETENTKKLFQKKIQSVQQNYETLLQEKLDLTIQKTEKKIILLDSIRKIRIHTINRECTHFSNILTI